MRTAQRLAFDRKIWLHHSPVVAGQAYRQHLGAGFQLEAVSPPGRGAAGFFWPVFFIAAWGIGLVMNAFDVYWRREITEQDIQHEMERADRRG